MKTRLNSPPLVKPPKCAALLIVTFRRETLTAVQRHHKHGICNGPCAGTIDTIPIKEWLNS